MTTTLWVVVTHNADGVEVFGHFDHHGDAETWAVKHGGKHWTIRQITQPKEGDQP